MPLPVQLGQRRFQQVFGFRARNQHRRVYLKRAAVKFTHTHNISHRLAAAAAFGGLV